MCQWCRHVRGSIRRQLFQPCLGSIVRWTQIWWRIITTGACVGGDHYQYLSVVRLLLSISMYVRKKQWSHSDTTRTLPCLKKKQSAFAAAAAARNLLNSAKQRSSNSHSIIWGGEMGQEGMEGKRAEGNEVKVERERKGVNWFKKISRLIT